MADSISNPVIKLTVALLVLSFITSIVAIEILSEFPTGEELEQTLALLAEIDFEINDENFRMLINESEWPVIINKPTSLTMHLLLKSKLFHSESQDYLLINLKDDPTLPESISNDAHIQYLTSAQSNGRVVIRNLEHWSSSTGIDRDLINNMNPFDRIGFFINLLQKYNGADSFSVSKIIPEADNACLVIQKHNDQIPIQHGSQPQVGKDIIQLTYGHKNGEPGSVIAGFSFERNEEGKIIPSTIELYDSVNTYNLKDFQNLISELGIVSTLEHCIDLAVSIPELRSNMNEIIGGSSD